MPYQRRHKLLTVMGTTFNGAEIFSFSLRLAGDGGLTPVTQAQVDGLAAATETMFEDGNLAICQWNKMTAIKLAPIDVNGNYPVGEIAYEHVYAPVISGGAVLTNIIWPPQCAYSVGLTTVAPRGRGHIGRFYLPSLAYNVSSATGKIGDLAPSAGPVLKTWINAINTFGDAGIVSVVSPLDTGYERAVTGLRFGQVVDTQRRRRNAISESYTSVTIP